MRHTRGTFLASGSLRLELLLFALALVLVPGILLVWIAERSGRDSLQRVIGRQLAREAGHTAERVFAALRAEHETLGDLARQDLMREIRVGDIDKRVSRALQTLREGSPVRIDYLVVEPDGSVVASSDPARIGPPPEWADPRWGGADAAEISLRPAASGSATPLVVATAPIADPDDPARRLGTLVGLFDWRLVTDETDAVRDELAAQGIAAAILVAPPDGAVIAGSRAPAEDAFDLAWLSEQPAEGAELPDYRADEAADLIVGRAALAPDLPGWILLVVEPRAHALAPAIGLSRRLRLTMGLAVLVALVVAALAARRVIRPLSELTRAIRGLGRGGAAPPVPVRSDDEVGTLARTFNEMAAQLDRTQRDLVEAEKFAFVGELAAGVAHEIRTSLGVLGSSAQILERTLPGAAHSEAGELAGMIRDEVSRLGGVVNDLLTLHRGHPLELEPTRLSALVRRAVDFVAPRAREAGIELHASCAEGEPEVLCDPELVHRLVVSLLVNAIEAIGSHGRVEVRVLGARGGYGGLEVQDDGPGVPDELRERIFQPFVTAREGGVGLGLTFVKRVVHEHRGEVDVESLPGRGTLFRVRLPLARAPA